MVIFLPPWKKKQTKLTWLLSLRKLTSLKLIKKDDFEKKNFNFFWNYNKLFFEF